MNLIKRNDLLQIYEQNLAKRDKTELSELLSYAHAGSLKRYLNRLPEAYLNLGETEVVSNFFLLRGGFDEQLAIANKKLQKRHFEKKETENLLEIIKYTIPKIQGISDIEYLNKVKEVLAVAISTLENQIKINNLH